MLIMPKLNIVLVSCLMIIGLSSNLSAQPGGKGGPPAHVNPGPPSHVKPGPPSNVRPWRGTKPPVHAPLDGGLLTILGAAGIGYYLLRRRRA